MQKTLNSQLRKLQFVGQSEKILLLLSFWIAIQGFFYRYYFVRVHDYLDHYFVLQKMWSQQIDLFDYSTRIEGVLSTINANALGFADLNPTLLLLKMAEPSLAYCLSDIALRVIALWSFYFLAIQTLKLPNDTWILVGATVFSGLDEIPSLAPTLFLSPLLILIFRRICNKGLDATSVVLTFISWQWSGVVYGGFVLLIYFCGTILSKSVKVQSLEKKTVLALLLNIFSATFAINRLIFSFFEGSFVSHRVDWVPNNISLNLILDIPFKFVEILTFQNSYLNGFDRALLISWFSYLVLVKKVYRHLSRNEALTSWGIAFAIFFVIVEEKLGILLRLGIPFQSNRIFTLFPLFFLMVLTKFTNHELQSAKRKQTKLLSTILVLGIVVTPQFYNSIRNTAIDQIVKSPALMNPLQEVYAHIKNLEQPIKESDALATKLLSKKATTIKNFYREAEYQKAKEVIHSDGIQSGTLSVGLDPMIASFNGINSFDGYVFNYELPYKSRFRPIIRDALTRNPENRDYFDKWGNRVYTSFGVGEKSIRDIDFCYAKKIGVRYVLMEKSLEPTMELQELAELNSMRVMKIICE